MRKYLLLFIGAITYNLSAYSQISITTTNTASICYNDGTLTISATGGTAPYTDSIISGPTNPNLTYPIALPTGQNVFTDLPHGTFTIVVHDAAGHSGTFTASVGGTYQFPTDTLYQNSYFGGGNLTDTLICLADSTTGRPPYQYALSATGANSGFGPYQSSNLFPKLCAGAYWIRLRDSCGNIFTNSYTVSYSVFAIQICTNVTTGYLSFIASGGIPPYTYTITDQTTNTTVASNQTGIFNALALSGHDTYIWSATDSCGTVADNFSPYIEPPLAFYSVNCPFNGDITMAGYLGGFPTAPVIINCLNCIPVQRDTFATIPYGGQVIFSGLTSGNTYYLEMFDGCGNATIDTYKIAPVVGIGWNYLSCRSLDFVYTDSGYQPVQLSDIDSTVLIYNSIRYMSKTGVFSDLPPDPYSSYHDTVEVYTNIGCNTKEAINFNYYTSIPNFQTYFDQARGPNCDLVWTGIHFASDAERIYFISSANDTTYGEAILGGGVNNKAYYYLQPGASYTVVSDSGCSEQITLPAIPGTYDSVTSYVDCQGVPTLMVSCYDSFTSIWNLYDINYSGKVQYAIEFYLHDSLVFTFDTASYNSTYNSGAYLTYNPTDTGLYTYKIYLLGVQYDNTDSLGQLINTFTTSTMYDTLCRQDSGTVYVTTSTVPFPYVNTAYKCNGISSGPPILTIYGGSIPYTVQIQGVDTFIMNTNSTVFPDTALGTYNIIAYDNCGISRSFTFSIRDTCACSMPTSVITATQTSGLGYQFGDSITGGGSGPFTYTWNFGDGSPLAYTSDPSHVFPVGSDNTNYHVTLIVTDPCGSDTLTEVVTPLTGMEGLELSQHVSVYPNPNQGSFTIAVDGISSTTLNTEVTDMLGRSMYKQAILTGENKFDLSLTSGVYMVKVSDGNASTVKMMTIK